MKYEIVCSSLTEMTKLTNVANQILIDEINRKDGVFKHEEIDIVANIFGGEKVCFLFVLPVQNEAHVIISFNTF